MKTISILVTALLIVTLLKAQDINRIEYFFDTDPGFGNGTALTFTPGLLVSVNFTADVTGLSHGMHMLCLRARNENNRWSVLAWIPFAAFDYSSQPDIVYLEYYIDNDPGFGSGESVPITTSKNVSTSFTVNVTGISNGMHMLCIRSKNNTGNWSILAWYPFYNYDPTITNIVRMEYFFDTDPGFGNGENITITEGTKVSALFVADVTGITEGYHNLFVRAKNNSGNWSILARYPFYKYDPTITDIVRMEYFFDTDPGYGNGENIPITAGTKVSALFVPDLTGISGGLHILFLRAKKSNNCWSMVQRAVFNNDEFAAHPISQLEYYYTDDPGFGNAKPVLITPTHLLSTTFQMDTVGTPPGLYTLVARVKNDKNRWSIIQSQPVKIKLKTWTAGVDNDWNNAENWDPVGVPGPADDVTIPQGTPYMPFVKNQGLACHNLLIAKNATLTINPLMTLLINGTITMEGE